jgi:hypothetical protein
MPTRPSILEASIGGYPGPWYSIELKQDALVYSVTQDTGRKSKAVEIQPSAKDWKRFHRVLEESAAWSWEAEYVNADILDGTSWHLRVEWEGSSLNSRGSNAYPSWFQSVLRGLSQLVGGRSFE